MKNRKKKLMITSNKSTNMNNRKINNKDNAKIPNLLQVIKAIRKMDLKIKSR